MVAVDILIVGAGPAGLFGAYYAGFRGLSVAVIDSLPEPGGQVSAMYPEKHLYDVPGFPAIKGKDLITHLLEQTGQYSPTYRLGEVAQSYAHDGESDLITITTDKGRRITCRAVVVTAGLGKFTPRPLAAAANWRGHGLSFFVTSFDEYIDRDVVVVGGGDSAFDWAMNLHDVARSVTVVHRRDRFRAHQGTVERVRELGVEIRTRAEVKRLVGDTDLEAVEITDIDSNVTSTRTAQRLVAALGFKADLGPLQDWGMKVHRRQIEVDTTMATSLHHVYAAGDITHYPGKLKLIAVGFGEVATAVNNAAVAIDPSVSLFPGHSTEKASPDRG